MESIEVERDAMVSIDKDFRRTDAMCRDLCRDRCRDRVVIETLRCCYLGVRFNLVNHNYHGVDTSKYGEQK